MTSPHPHRDAGWHPLEAWRLLRRRLWPFVTVLGLTLLAAVIITIRTTRQYRAVSTVVIERQTPRTGTLQDIQLPDTFNQDYYQTQYKILQSRTLGERTMEKLKLGDREEFTISSDPVTKFLASLEVIPARGSRVVTVTYEHPDAKLSAEIVNTLVKEYIADSVQRRVASLQEINRQLQKESEDLLAKLDQSEKTLHAFNQEHQLATVDEKQNISTRRLDDAIIALTKAEEEYARLQSISEQARRGNGDVEHLFRVKGVLDSKVVQDLMLEEARVKQEIADQAKRYKDRHPVMDALRARLADTQAALQREASRIVSHIEAEVEDAATRLESGRAVLEVRKQEKLDLDSVITRSQVLMRGRDANKVLYDSLIKRIKESEVTSSLEINNVSVLDLARAPIKPSKPNIPLNMAFGLGAGTLLALGLIALLERIDVTVKGREEIEELLGLPVIGMIRAMPTSEGMPETVTARDQRSTSAESFRAVRTALLLSPKGGAALKKILVTSSSPGDGKTCNSLNLSITLAQAGHKTLLIDCDFHRPQLHKHLELSNDRGFADALVGEGDVESYAQTTSVPNLSFLCAGSTPPAPAELLGSPQMKLRLDEASKKFDRIVIDTSPVCAVTDACIVAPHVDGVVLIVQPGKTDRHGAKRAVELLAGVGVKPVGIVLNRIPSGSAGYGYYGYGYYGYGYYGYGYPAKGDAKAKPTTT